MSYSLIIDQPPCKTNGTYADSVEFHSLRLFQQIASCFMISQQIDHPDRKITADECF
jgi:hypothetical protein